jgi:hypothetical protein
MHHDIDAGLEEGDGEETFREVLQSIASFKAERRHGAGHDDGYLEVGQRALEIGGDDGIRTRGLCRDSEPSNGTAMTYGGALGAFSSV